MVRSKQNVKKSSKLIVAVLISSLSLFFATNAWCHIEGEVNTIAPPDADAFIGRMNRARAAGDFNREQEIYTEATQNPGTSNIMTYVVHMLAAGDAGDFGEVHNRGFRDARNRGRHFVSVILYDTYITLAGKFKKIKDARIAFDEAVRLKLATPITYGIFMRALANAEEFDEEQRVFIQASHLGLANEHVYNVHIDILIERGEIEKAIRLFVEHYGEFPHQCTRVGKFFDFIRS